MIKVKVVGCSVLQIGSERHVRGDIVEIPESMFEADLYAVVEPKPKRTRKTKKVVTEKPKEDAVSQSTTDEAKFVKVTDGEPVEGFATNDSMSTALIAPLDEVKEDVKEETPKKRTRRKRR